MAEEILYYGQYGIPIIGDAKVDRLNILSVEVSVPQKDPVDYTKLSIYAAPANMVSLPCVGCRLIKGKGEHAFVYSYDGKLNPDDPSETVYELDGTDSNEPIETHPQFLDLVSKYGGTYNADGSFSGFPKMMPSAKPPVKSPLFGITDFISIGWTWSKSYTSPIIPVTAYQNAGCIEKPSGIEDQQPPQLNGVRDWLRLAPRCSWRGNVWSISERWQASGRNGINKDVYKTIT